MNLATRENTRAAGGADQVTPVHTQDPARSPQQPVRIIDLKEVKHRTSLGSSCVYDLMKRGTFPRSIKLGARRVGWLLSDIEAWILARVSEAAAPTTTEAKA
jgi:prophage regulatory protein